MVDARFEGRTHGTASCFKAGCHCDECAAGNRLRRWKRVNNIPADVKVDGHYVTGSHVPFPGDWALDGACRDAPDPLWFPKYGVNGWTRKQRNAAAKAVCAGCPVKKQCLEYALEHPTITGIWGETTTADRKRIRKATKEAAA